VDFWALFEPARKNCGVCNATIPDLEQAPGRDFPRAMMYPGGRREPRARLWRAFFLRVTPDYLIFIQKIKKISLSISEKAAILRMYSI
jgi:hypothetical protein